MNPRDLQLAFQKLSPRERMLVMGAVTVLALFSFYLFIWEPLTEAELRVKQRIRIKRDQLVQIQQLRETYNDLNVQFELGQRVFMEDKSFPLLQHIETAVKQVVGDAHIVSMNPQAKTISDTYREEYVELKLNDIALAQLVEMLHRIEKGDKPLRVTRLHLKKTRTQGMFEVTAVVSLLQKIEVPT